jgi:hypothetical protein
MTVEFSDRGGRSFRDRAFGSRRRRHAEGGGRGQAGARYGVLLAWLGHLRAAVLRKAEGVSEDQAGWTPDGKLISIKGS